MYSILNCNLVCIRNGAHVNKKKKLGEATHPLCLCLRLFHSHENTMASHVHQIQKCRGSTGSPLTARVAATGISNPAKENFRTPVCDSCDVNSRADMPTVFQNNNVLLSTCARTNLTSQSPLPQKINPSPSLSCQSEENGQTTPCSSQVPGSLLAQCLFYVRLQ